MLYEASGISKVAHWDTCFQTSTSLFHLEPDGSSCISIRRFEQSVVKSNPAFLRWSSATKQASDNHRKRCRFHLESFSSSCQPCRPTQDAMSAENAAHAPPMPIYPGSSMPEQKLRGLRNAVRKESTFSDPQALPPHFFCSPVNPASRTPSAGSACQSSHPDRE